jgi:hypothetical protein
MKLPGGSKLAGGMEDTYSKTENFLSEFSVYEMPVSGKLRRLK